MCNNGVMESKTNTAEKLDYLYARHLPQISPEEYRAGDWTDVGEGLAVSESGKAVFLENMSSRAIPHKRDNKWLPISQLRGVQDGPYNRVAAPCWLFR